MKPPSWLVSRPDAFDQLTALRSMPCFCRFCSKPVAWCVSTQMAAIETSCCQSAFLLPVDGLGSDWCDKLRRDLSEWIVFPATG